MTSAAATSVSPPLRQDVALLSLVGLVHGTSHFCQLLLPPLFPWLKDAFGVGYTELGLVLTVFFVVSCAVQAISGFMVDRYGARPILAAGLFLLGLAAAGFASATSYAALIMFAVLAGVGNGVFHPVDFTLMNRKLHASRLGHAYSVHGITGSLGWAIAPALLVPLAMAGSWRHALGVASVGVFLVLAVVLWQWQRLHLAMPVPARREAKGTGVSDSSRDGAFDFLRVPAVWMCFLFFLLFASVLSVVQAFAPEAARQLHGVPVRWAALCLTIYMVCSACGMVVGGFLVADAARAEQIIAVGIGTAAVIALTLGLAPLAWQAVPVLFGAMGLSAGLASPSRDMLVKQSTPPHATGRVYGVVYAGLDIGQAMAPLGFGLLMDTGRHATVWIGVAVLQALLIGTAFRVRQARRVVAS